MFKTIWYYFVKAYIKTGLFFYAKQIKVSGLENIPKKGAVLFTSNHPNGLIDPLIIATHNPRINHYLVRAAVFKKPLIKKLLGTLNLMPIYRIRDGKSQLSKNNQVFDKCFEILNNKQALMIFPEGSHGRVRKIRPISKGFTRILFGAIDKFSNLQITIIPVGLTYQNASVFPAKIALQYGKPILTNDFYNSDELIASTNNLKEEVRKSLEDITTSITSDLEYDSILTNLNAANVDFTNVEKVNSVIRNGKKLKPSNKEVNYLKPLFYLIILNSIIPYSIWKKASKKIDEIEFVDTFRFGLGIVIFPLFYLLQSLVIHYFFGGKIALIYFSVSFLLVLIYTKFSPTNTEDNK